MDYILKHKDIDVLCFSFNEKSEVSGVGGIITPEHAPLGILNSENSSAVDAMGEWWRHRTIPASRDNLESGLARLGVETTAELLKKSYGLSLSDHYWVCPDGANLRWRDVNYYENDFSRDVGRILFDGDDGGGGINFFSPDNSSDGNLMKKWAIEEDGTRVMIKGGDVYNPQESFNEVIAAEIFRRLGIPHATYKVLADRRNNTFYSKSPNFTTEKLEAVNAAYVIRPFRHGTGNAYEHFMSCCEKVGIRRESFEGDMVAMLLVDYMMANTDRHFRNFGFMRDSETLEWKGLAPVYDTGSSLFAGLATIDLENVFFLDSKNIGAKPFARSQRGQMELLPVGKFCAGLPFGSLDGMDVFCADLLRLNHRMSDRRKELVCGVLADRICEATDIALGRKIRH